MSKQELWRAESEIRIGVSLCLLGEPVRYDSGHKRDRFLVETLADYVTWVAVCPEVEAGMSVPRPPMRLERRTNGIRMVEIQSGRDWTPVMKAFSRQRVRNLRAQDLCGYVLKKGSPSCGMERVKIYRKEKERPEAGGTGLFAEELRRQFPLLPVEEEGRLHDPVLRENFIECVFAYRRWKDFVSERFSRHKLVRFHTAHKFLLLSHSPTRYRELGRVVAGARELGAMKARAEYGRLFMEAMAEKASRRKQTNVLMHMSGFFKQTATSETRAELLRLIMDYRQGLLPLVVPITLIRHLARSTNQEYLLGQIYLDPHPKELMLRNHV